MREIENENSLQSYQNFVPEFVNEQNVKESNIIKSLNIVKKCFDDLVIIENDKTNNKY